MLGRRRFLDNTARGALAAAGLGAARLHAYAITPTAGQAPERMAWWREARFGLFIHWGLYSILAGEWGGRTDYAEWIRNNAHIPIGEYDRLVGRFNPVAFDADRWAAMAKDAGMRYLTITTKHHDGFCLFDSRLTRFSVGATPFRRDIMRGDRRRLPRPGYPPMLVPLDHGLAPP